MLLGALSRFWCSSALMAALAVAVISMQSDRLAAQQPPNNPATGTPTISGTPRVGEVLWVDLTTIADADGLENAEFQFQIVADDDISTSVAELRALSFTNSYIIRPYDAGLQIGFRLSFDDDAGNSESVEYVWTSAVAAVVPAPPENLSASIISGDLSLSWSAPSHEFSTGDTDGVGDGGSDITGYKVQWKLASRSWASAGNITEETVTGTTHVVSGLNTSSTYTARVLAVNAIGDGAPSTEVTVSGTSVNVGPVVSGLSFPRLAETNRVPLVTTYTVSDPESDAIAWSLSGPDRDALTIAGGELVFRVRQDFENPRDADRNNTFEIVVMASDGSNLAGKRVTVIMWDIDEAPVITGPSTVRYSPGGTSAVAMYNATDAEGAAVTWDVLAGTDAAAFAFDNGTLRFLQPPDLSNPGDSDGDNVYHVTVQASAGRPKGGRTGTPAGPGTLDVTITVANPPVIITGPIGGGGPSGPTPSDIDFEWNVTRDISELDGGNDDATGLWSDGETLWIADNPNGAGDAVYAYDLETGERDEDREFDLAETNRAPRGVWSDGGTMWVSDSGQDRLFAYDLKTDEQAPERDIVLADDNSDARGIWSDNSTLWVLDDHAGALFTYRLEDGALLAEHDLDAANAEPHGLWSDGVTFWLSDHGAKRLFAYQLEGDSLVRAQDEDFTGLSTAGNNSPRGIWSDGAVMYVADANDGKVYTYNMPDAIDTRLASLDLSGVDFGEFSPLRTDYAGDTIPHGNIATLTATAVQDDATLEITPADHDGDESNGYQLRLLPGLEITVTVTSPDGSRERAYRLLLGDEEQVEAPTGPADDCLRGVVDARFSLVTYEGGSMDDLEACAAHVGMSSVYVRDEGEWVSLILGAPEFVNSAFRELYAEGVPAVTPMIAQRADPAGDES